MPLAAVFGLASSNTTPALLPPSSSVMRFSVSAALAITFPPVAVDPVNEISVHPDDGSALRQDRQRW
jgi:hypothetical protein